ncbi:15890_t:CDS:10 [Acaulospora morrowiae]|uniref:RNA helicase n=1 Tax=Acaulospora morrowiae TaxID=94023 RepID=A0A9N8W180_9GLOM|nr:15890_t:CDS:10 [Acaulospora morrowiae]
MEFKELDPRLSRALSKLNFHKPTPVQVKAIPLALSGKDILARARTGSGKTAAYCLPIIQKILNAKEAKSSTDSAKIRSIILVPTRELAEQVTRHINSFIVYCSKEVRVVNIANTIPVHLQKSILAESPDIVVTTPSRALANFEAQNLDVRTTLESLVIDEADLVLSYGYEEDVQKILTYLPKIFQCYLMSATLTKDIDRLKHLLLRNPVILTLHEENEVNQLTQYCVRCSEIDKFLLIYVILKLRLIKGKCIIFVNDIDRCYRLKLFLEQFSIKACVLNSELPLNSRYHIVQEFNKGIYDYIVATDEDDLKADLDTEDEMSDDGESLKDEAQEGSSSKVKFTLPDKQQNTKSNIPKKDNEYGVSRGIDFINVAAVINFDFPTSARSYTHRIGRTARAVHKGMSLSFVVPKEFVGMHKNVACSTAKHDEEVYQRVEKRQSMIGATLKPYSFDMKQVEGFRYRTEDALRAVTRAAIREARLKDIKLEILNSEKLKSHFEDNPNDLKILRHDTTIHPARVQQHMKHVPSYLMPKIATPVAVGTDVGHIPFRKTSSNNRRPSKRTYGAKKRKDDPLKSFNFNGSSVKNSGRSKRQVLG